MMMTDDKIEAYYNRLLDDYLAGQDEWWAYIVWSEEEGLDADLQDSWEAWEAYRDQMAEDAAVERYESRMIDDYYDTEYP